MCVWAGVGGGGGGVYTASRCPSVRYVLVSERGYIISTAY